MASEQSNETAQVNAFLKHDRPWMALARSYRGVVILLILVAVGARVEGMARLIELLHR